MGQWVQASVSEGKVKGWAANKKDAEPYDPAPVWITSGVLFDAT